MKLDGIGKLSHGMILSRIEMKPGEKGEELELFTMQALTREIGNYDVSVEPHTIFVAEHRVKELPLTNQGMILIGLTSNKAVVITKEHEGKVIPSNFAYLVYDKALLDPNYFTWYFNESSDIKRQLRIIAQGSIIGALSIQMLRDLEIALPSMDKQTRLGRVHQLRQRKKRLAFEKYELEEKLMNQVMIQHLKGD